MLSALDATHTSSSSCSAASDMHDDVDDDGATAAGANNATARGRASAPSALESQPLPVWCGGREDSGGRAHPRQPGSGLVILQPYQPPQQQQQQHMPQFQLTVS